MPEGGFTVQGVSNNRIRIEPTEIRAEGGPVYPRVIVPLHMDMKPGGSQQDQGFTTISVECGLFLKDHGLKISDATATTNLAVVRSAGYIAVWYLEFPLDPFRVKGLEARRHGDLKLRFDLSFILGLLVRVVLPDRTSQGPTDIITGFEKTTSQIDVEVPQSHWAGKILPALGSNEYFLVEIPTRSEHIATAWNLIEQAENAFDRWDTKAVFAHCREAESALTNIVSKHHAGNSFLTQERWKRASKEFSHFASLDLHLESIKAKSNYSTDQVQMGKSDAECLLIFVKALAKYAEELVRAEPQEVSGTGRPTIT